MSCLSMSHRQWQDQKRQRISHLSSSPAQTSFLHVFETPSVRWQCCWPSILSTFSLLHRDRLWRTSFTVNKESSSWKRLPISPSSIWSSQHSLKSTKQTRYDYKACFTINISNQCHSVLVSENT